MSWIAAGGLALSAGGQIFSAFKSSKANSDAEDLINEQIESNKADYALDRNYMESNEAKTVLTKAREQSDRNNKIAENKAAVTGGTAESELAEKKTNNKMYSDTVRNLAQVGSQRSYAAKQTYNNNLNRLLGMKMGLTQQSAQNAANLASNAGQLVSSASYLSAFNPSGNTTNSTENTAK